MRRGSEGWKEMVRLMVLFTRGPPVHSLFLKYTLHKSFITRSTRFLHERRQEGGHRPRQNLESAINLSIFNKFNVVFLNTGEQSKELKPPFSWKPVAECLINLPDKCNKEN